MSSRSEKEFVPVNCSAIPENLLESEFFGHKKGAFTGAHADKQGYLALADGGTLFLDEVGELGLSLQAKMLRAIEGGGYSPVGSSVNKLSDFRIIAATNQNLLEQVRKRGIREDFFYRIHVIPINVPPLRDRKEDIPLLMEHFLKLYSENGDPPPVPGQVLEALMSYDWPGNVRELQNAIQRYIAVKRLEFIPSSPSARNHLEAVESSKLMEMERDGGKGPRHLAKDPVQEDEETGHGLASSHRFCRWLAYSVSIVPHNGHSRAITVPSHPRTINTGVCVHCYLHVVAQVSQPCDTPPV